MVKTAARMRDEMMKGLKQEDKEKIAAVGKESLGVSMTKEEMKKEARKLLISKRFAKLGKDRVCLQELMVYGIKGLAAYAYHAIELGEDCSDVVAEICRLIGDVLQIADPSVDVLLGGRRIIKKNNILAMEPLSARNTQHYGHPEPTRVQRSQDACNGRRNHGKARHISRHHLLELARLPQQCEG